MLPNYNFIKSVEQIIGYRNKASLNIQLEYYYQQLTI
jgi:hypothetical protein